MCQMFMCAFSGPYHRKLQETRLIGLRHLRSVTFSSALNSVSQLPGLRPLEGISSPDVQDVSEYCYVYGSKL